jgi:hypothetical protein
MGYTSRREKGKRKYSSSEEGISKKSAIASWQSRSYAKIFSPCSYDIIFCVPFFDANRAVDPIYAWSSFEWYSCNIHADSPDKVYPKRLSPFWKGQTPFSAAFVALGSHIYCFGGRASSREPIRDVSKLRIAPRVDKEWVSVFPKMISGRYYSSASVLGGKVYIRSHDHSYHTGAHWSEVFDPVNGKWEALPNPPMYTDDWLIICATLENPDRIIAAFCVLEDYNYATFYEYDVHHRSWKELEPARRKIHPMCRREWLQRTLSVGNTLYWIERRHDEIMLIAYDVDLDVWLERHVEGLETSCIPYDELSGGPGLPRLLHLEKRRFCVLECTVDDCLHCLVFDVSHTRDKSMGISFAWEQKYKVGPKERKGLPHILHYCTLLKH